MVDGDLLLGLRALGKQEREEQERHDFVRDLFKTEETWGDKILKKHYDRMSTEIESQGHSHEEGEV